MAAPETTAAWRVELRATAALAGSLALANVLQMAVYATDVMFVGRLGPQALAASSLSVSLFGLMMWGFSALTGAATPLIAAELGRRAHAVREVRRSVRMALWLAVACGLAGMAVCAFGERILLAAGEDAAVSARAGGFLRVLAWAMMPMVMANVLRNFVAAAGRPGFATAVTALAILVNATGNYAFVFGHFGAPALGLPGSALSSVLTALATVLAYALAIAADRRLRRFRLFGRWWVADWPRLREIVGIGAPIALTVVAEGGLFGGAAFLMGLLGEAELAGHTVALQLAAFAFQLPLGIGQAATIRVGLHFGAADAAGVARAGYTAIAFGLAVAMASATAMIVAPGALIGVYVDLADPANAAMIGFARSYLVIAAAFQLADGVQAIAAGALRGLQDTRVPMAIALFGYWLPGFGTAVVLGFLTPLRGNGVWLGLAAGLVVVAALLLRRWVRAARPAIHAA
ncbi:MAG: MATE family efflux transporter [Sphingomonadales bacterium]|nr:MATE family efflux transporter [Sphingomonadales bacterium]